MNILFIAGSANQIGGIEKYNCNYVAALREARTGVVLIERKPGGLAAKIIFAIKVLMRAFFKKPDFIICAHIHFSPLCLYLKKFLKIPYSISVYGGEVADITNKNYRNALRAADVITYLFNSTAQDVVRQVLEAKEKIFNLQNSVDGEKFKIKEKSESLLSRYGLSNSKIILTIGRMSKLDGDNKGYRRIIKAMPKVLEAVPDAKYLLAGSGSDVLEVKQLIIELGLQEKVVLADAPTDEEIVDYYNLADVFVLPSKNEGFPPIVILEALFCGIPVIGGNQRDAEEAMLNGELGLIVEAENIAAISEAIIKMLKKEAHLEFFDKKSLRAKALGVYGLAVYKEQIKKFLDLIKKINKQ